MKQVLAYDHSNVSRHDILRCITILPYKSVIKMLLLIVIAMMWHIGHEELGKAQSDNMNPIIMHIHPQLSLLVNDMSFSVPAQIGMQSMSEMNMSAMAPLQTHDNSGIIHVESTVNRNYTLGEFPNIWGLNLDDKVVKVTINGKPLTDFKNHLLRDGEQIKLEVQ